MSEVRVGMQVMAKGPGEQASSQVCIPETDLASVSVLWHYVLQQQRIRGQ
jgi:hypothetical protein